jgi:hypothetical protein
MTSHHNANEALCAALGLSHLKNITEVNVQLTPDTFPRVTVQRLLFEDEGLSNVNGVKELIQHYTLQPVAQPEQPEQPERPAFDLDKACRDGLNRVLDDIELSAYRHRKAVMNDFTTTRTDMLRRHLATLYEMAANRFADIVATTFSNANP